MQEYITRAVRSASRLTMRKVYFLLIASVFLIKGCISDKPDTEQDEPPVRAGKRVWILNEGNFQFGNASLGIYSPEDSVYSGEVFKTVNERPLGDVLQSMMMMNGKAYLVVNNSQKIEVLNPEDYESTSAITGFSSPRYILPVSDHKAYVSDLYSNVIHIIDPEQGRITGEIAAEGWTDKMLLSHNKVFVTMPHHDYIYVVDATSDEPLDSIELTDNPNSLAEDNFGRIWVLCGGGSGNPASLFSIDPQSHEVLSTIPLEGKTGAGNLVASHDGLRMYFLREGVYLLNPESGVVSETPVIPAEGRNFYSIGTDPQNHDLYLSDAKDYTQKGSIYRYDKNLKLLDHFTAGIIPGGFYFD